MLNTLFSNKTKIKGISSKLSKASIAASTIIFSSSAALAAPEPVDVDPVDSAMNFICKWGWKLGVVIAFIGAFQLAMGFKNDDANAKTTGLRVLVSGSMVAGLCFAGYKTVFGL